MRPDEEQIWQEPPPMPADVLPGREAIRLRELGRVLRSLSRARVVLLAIVLVVLVMMFVLDQVNWRFSALLVVAVMFGGIAAHDVIRLKRSADHPPKNLPLDVLMAVLVQTAVILFTGGIESPLIIAYMITALFAGIALGRTPASRALLLLISALLWSITLGQMYGLVPRTVPDFLGLEPGFVDRKVYAVSTAAVVNLAALALYNLGAFLNATVDRMLDVAIGARQQALTALADRNRELVLLSSAIAHELKNPLASIHGLVQLLEKGGDNSAQRFEVLKKEIARTRGILDEFLNFSRPLGELTISQVSPRQLFTELTELHEGLSEDRAIRVLPPTTDPAPIRCDPRKIKQALVNLLQNALEATPRGGRIQWLAESTETHFLLGVRDTGPGLTEAMLERAAGLGNTTKSTGSGIGLAVARSIAEQHGGQLLLENAPDGGCVARISISRALSDPERGSTS